MVDRKRLLDLADKLLTLLEREAPDLDFAAHGAALKIASELRAGSEFAGRTTPPAGAAL